MPVTTTDTRFLRLAQEVASWSKDPACKVGAVVVSPDRRRLTVGYNGFPRGVADTTKRLNGMDRLPLTVHAELNAILNAACDLTGWTLYSTKFPCLDCAKAIIQARIARVVSPRPIMRSSWYGSNMQGLELMREVGVQCDME